MSKRTDTVLHITPAQYQKYAEIAKAHGMVLRLFEQPTQIIGLASGSDVAVIDATSDREIVSFTEAASLLLCLTVDTGSVRRNAYKRFECDLAQLSDSEMYLFWLHHEIGHRADNYCSLSFQFSRAADDPDFRSETLRRMWQANEILADRWAWTQVCDRPMPLTAVGRRDQDAIQAELDFLDRVTGGRKCYTNHPAPHVKAGLYHGIPIRMLARHDATTWIGPDISPCVTERAREYEARVAKNPLNYLPEKLLHTGFRERPPLMPGSSVVALQEAA
ncbi:hypothetical protein [Achromobacter insolitus]|uniref:hypothetical protein n=1 Tax=Achromobacter insolitus TaxID=217204 RepID=UPI0007C359BF|nr:hypothetical protein [Achromobacter insolitus]OAD12268.1 hypothetical protein A3839_22620 [Achromobacter insolitus]